MSQQDVEARRERWRQYFAQTLRQNDAAHQAAADAAMFVIYNGGSREQAVAAGREAAGATQSSHAAGVGPDAFARAKGVPPPNSAVVASVERRTENLDGTFFQVWSLRIRPLGNGQPSETIIPVELRGRSVIGQVQKGDLVSIPPGREGTTRIVKTLRNVTTNSTIEAKGRPFRRTRTITRSAALLTKLIGALIALAVLAVIVLVAIFLFSGDSSVSF